MSVIKSKKLREELLNNMVFSSEMATTMLYYQSPPETNSPVDGHDGMKEV